ncbi:class I SAM-dependent DNA methyltransferase [Sphingobacterium sp. C459-1T]|uniref:site-specific DNA-methyltransferase (adenine-specific) n=2 Tax=Sphingobacterium faecale TaxID=2803775 RepID=A0ABS1R286_9SPHI|nr:class I SAM-dependent DNA methyltransferase [Sphingobacterium faecale]
MKKLLASIDSDTFIYDFLLAFGTPKATIARLQSGKINLGEVDGELVWKKKLLYRQVAVGTNLLELIQELRSDVGLKKSQPRFVMVTDLVGLLAVDLQTEDTLDCAVADLDKHFDFFLPFAGIEKAQYLCENPADVKAAEKMAKLYDQINLDNQFSAEEEVHQLNVFLSRLLFCYFAEDTGIFEDKLFTAAITSNTKADASDTQEYLQDLFLILNTDDGSRNNEKQYLHKFPYVNGGLFREVYPIPVLTVKSRNLILECGQLDWSAINPDIFGSMIQAVVTTDKRGGLGMHYTSVPNIMKVINPLFLDELEEEYQKAKGNVKQLNALIQRIANIKIFDPACGSGNFLIIAYKKLRELEIQILNDLTALKGNKGSGTLDFVSFNSLISLNNFFGIEIDDFAHEIARLSLWLAEHQMNQAFRKEFGHSRPALPLKDSGKIIHANACRVDWEEVCPKEEGDEIYILGNPPYLGYSLQDKSQKDDMELVFGKTKSFKVLDYISCWFYKGTQYISGVNVKLALVSTNSICQGEQTFALWSKILKSDLEIDFAHQSFKWGNNAKGKAAVICIIVGLRNKSNKAKYLFKDDKRFLAVNINPYLVDGSTIYVERRNTPISNLQQIIRGTGFSDNGNLLLSDLDKQLVLDKYPFAQEVIKKVVGSYELINKVNRWCLWFDDCNVENYKTVVFFGDRIQNVEDFRKKSKKSSTNIASNMPHKATENRFNPESSIVIPRVSSERREYIPIDIMDPNTVILDSAQAIYNPKIYLIGVLTSKMHMVWMKTTAGRLKNDYRYSSALSYNTFPFPKISKEKEKELEECAYQILETRERYPEKTLAQLYDPDKMPDDLREAHRLNDLAVESCYRAKPFDSDEERLEHLFKLYEKMIAAEKKK